MCINILISAVVWSMLVCKMPQFRAKATDSDSPSYFSKSRHHEITRNSSYVLSPEESQKKGISSYIFDFN